MDSHEYYFTFGVDHPLTLFTQPVSAPDEQSACRGMRYFYGNHWVRCYRVKELLSVEKDLVEFPLSVFMRRISRKIVVDGDKIYTEREVKA